MQRRLVLDTLAYVALNFAHEQTSQWQLALQMRHPTTGSPQCDVVGFAALFSACEEGRGSSPLPASTPAARPERLWGAEVTKMEELQSRHGVFVPVIKQMRSQRVQSVQEILDFGLSFTRLALAVTIHGGKTGEPLRTRQRPTPLTTSLISLPVRPVQGTLPLEAHDFISNNRGINEGEDIPQEVQTQVFESIRQDEIKTPSSGSFIEGISRTRWEDFLTLSRKGWRDNSLTTQSSSLTGQAAGFLQRLGQTFRDVLEFSLASEGGAETFAATGLEQLLRLALQLQRPEADRAAESLFFFASEVFHEAQSEMVLARGASCLRALVRTVHSSATEPSWSTKHIHLLVYLSVQFAVYGVFEKILPPIDAATRKLLLCPVLPVDPPTGVVYNFLRKISTAPFKMLSFADADGGAKVDGQGSSVRSASAPVHAEEESPPPPPRLKSAGALRGNVPEVESDPVDADTVTSEDSNEAVQDMPEDVDSEGFLQKDPLKPQIQHVFEASDLDVFFKVMLEPWRVWDAQVEACG
eukprot:symbB.v1.2.019867.t3/scaffold1647.1/size107771/3